MDQSWFKGKHRSRAVREEFAYVEEENEVEDNLKKTGFAFPEGDNSACMVAKKEMLKF